MKDQYEKFAFDYDEFASFFGDEKPFFEKLFKEHGVKTVLDCACGTGRHLGMFSEMGLNVSGSDYSESMLEVAKNNLKTLGAAIPLCQCDFRFLEQKHAATFDAVVCLTTALPHLHTDEDLVTALKSMKNRLNQGGLLILTQRNIHKTLSPPTIDVVANTRDFSRVAVRANDGRFQTLSVLDLFHSDSRTESNQYDIILRILLDDDHRRLLSEAGFNEISIYGDLDRSEYTEKSRLLIAIAKCS